MPDDGSQVGEFARAPHVHTANAEFNLGPLRSRASVRITTAGLVAIGGLVSGILLSVVPIVWAATSVARERARRPVEWDH